MPTSCKRQLLVRKFRTMVYQILKIYTAQFVCLQDYDRDTEILKEIREFTVLVICSSLEIIPFAGRTVENFKELLKNFSPQRKLDMQWGTLDSID